MAGFWSKIQTVGSLIGAVGGLAGGVGGLTGFKALEHSLHMEHLETLSKANKLNTLYGDNYKNMMSSFTNYREDCKKRGLSYTEAFRRHAREADREAEKHRGSLAGFWDMVCV